MDPILADIFIREAKRTFAFLESRGFSLQDEAIEITPLLVRIPFLGTNIAIILSYDDRAKTVDCSIARVRDGAVVRGRAEGGYWSELYTYLVKRQGFRGSIGGKDAPVKERIEERLCVELDDYAKALQQHGQAILTDPPGVMP